MPKERWVSFPHCEGPDGTLVIAWAGYDHLQLARAISAYYVDIQERLGGRDDPRLVPLLACLLELLPWLKQWHNEPDAAFDGLRMGDYFEGFINEEARQLARRSPKSKPGSRRRRLRRADSRGNSRINEQSPNVVVVAGPNGSGKSTAAPALFRDYLGITEFVNADVIAQGLSGFAAENAAMQAGRVMLERLRELARRNADFAFETTLASRTFAPRLEELRDAGYRTHLLFLWLPSPEMAVARVASRVQQGGHNVPDDIVIRRYHAGLRNSSRPYVPIVDALDDVRQLTA